MRLMQETHLAGILLMGTVLTPGHISFFRESRMPIVVCGQNHPSVTCVYHDDRGAAKESTKEDMSLLAIRQVSAVACSGESGPSVMAISEAPRERANSIASMERAV